MIAARLPHGIRWHRVSEDRSTPATLVTLCGHEAPAKWRRTSTAALPDCDHCRRAQQKQIRSLAKVRAVIGEDTLARWVVPFGRTA